MPGQVATVVQDTDDFKTWRFDPEDQEVPGLLHGYAGDAAATGGEVIEGNIGRKAWPLADAGVVWGGFDIANRLDEQRLIAQGGLLAELVLTPEENGFDIAARRRGKDCPHSGLHLSHALATPQTGCEFLRSLRADLANVAGKILDGGKFQALSALELVDAFLNSAAQPFELGAVFRVALLEEAQSLTDHFAGVAIAAFLNSRGNEAVEVFGQEDVSRGHANS
jgi:hypothetical protein